VRVRIDLHSHSTFSDGTTTPTELRQHAAALGIDGLGLTDHDTAAGWGEAAGAAEASGVCLVPGMEISTKHLGRGVHVLAYLLDPTYPPLVTELGRIMEGRDSRIEAMLSGLAAAGVHLTRDEVRRQAGEHPVIGRPHVADAMVARRIVSSRHEAFATWLDPGMPGFVVRYAPATEDMIALVTAAGGAAVIAHPWGRSSRRVLQRDALEAFRAHGLVGVEVDHQDHSAHERSELRELAAELDLVATGSSDYHGAGKVDHELGCNVTAPGELRRLLAAAAANARASGRSVAAVVGAVPGSAVPGSAVPGSAVPGSAVPGSAVPRVGAS